MNRPSDVARAVDERVRREALRQIESIDVDDDDWRIEPLPTFGDVEAGDAEDASSDGLGLGQSWRVDQQRIRRRV